MAAPLSPRDDLIRVLRDACRCRFQAHRRLSTTDTRLTWIVSLSTAYVIVLTVLPYLLKSPPYVADYLNLAAVAFSIIILVASLLQYSSQNSVRAEQMHRSGLEINEIRRNLLYLTSLEESSLQNFIDGYNLVLQKYSVNHDQLDYHAVVAESPTDYPWAGQAQVRSYKWENWRYGMRTLLMLWGATFVFIGLVAAAYIHPTFASPDARIGYGVAAKPLAAR